MLERMNRAILDMPASGIRRVADAVRQIEGCISLTLGEPGFDTPLPIREATKRALDDGYTHYPPNAGMMPLREAVARHEAAKAGEDITAEQVLITCGSTEALCCALMAVVEPGDEVIVPQPAFGLYAQQLYLVRGTLVPLHTAQWDFQLDAAALAQCVTPRTKAIVLNSPNNPTGVQYTQASLDTAIDICNRHNLFLIFDAVYDELAYEGKPPAPTAARLGDRLIRCNAFSKPYAMTGWRMGYCIAAPVQLAQLAKVHAALAVGVSTFSQVGCEHIFDVDPSPMRGAYARNRDIVYARLHGMGMQVVRPDGAFYAFPSIAAYGMDDDTFALRLMQEQRVAVVPGNCFGTPGHVRISYCCEEALLTEGLNRLERFVQSL